jgi:predicted molibdopterin-dependent oxidoreductase YjgC
VIASTGLSNEELFLIREVCQRGLGASVMAAVPVPPGYCDDFLIKADKSPNTRGATVLGLAGPDAPPVDSILADALAGRLDALWVFELDLAALIGDSQFDALSRSVDLLIYSGTNDNSTAAATHWVLPSAAYLEKDGTFVNCHGRVQRIGRALPPLAGSREDWAVLVDIAQRLDLQLPGRTPQELFLALANSVAAFEGLSYEAIGSRGKSIRQ